jgi:hypothetical protein
MDSYYSNDSQLSFHGTSEAVAKGKIIHAAYLNLRRRWEFLPEFWAPTPISLLILKLCNFQYCQVYGEVLISEVSYKINHLTNTNAEGNNVTTQADLDFWNKLKAQYPFSEKPVFISRDSVCRPAYDYVPTGVSEVTIMDNSGNALDSYTVTKTETGFTIQKGATGNPDQSYTITLNKLEELDATYGNIGQIRDGEMYIKEQIQSQT